MNMPDFTWVDWVFLGVAVASMALGLLRGLIQEAASLGLWILAFVGASRLSNTAAVPLAEFAPEPLPVILGFLLVFLLIMLIGRLLTSALREVVHKVGGSLIDQGLGGVFGLGRGLLIALALAILATLTPLIESPAWQTAVLRTPMEQGIRLAVPHLPNSISSRIPDTFRR